MKNIIIFIAIAAAVMSSGCINGNGIGAEPFNPDGMNNNSNDSGDGLALITLNAEGPIAAGLCSERGLNDKIIMLQSKYCGACKIAMPRLKEVESETGADIIFLDLSEKGDLETMKSFHIVPQYTPTLVVGCDVYIGAKSKDSYKNIVEAFMGAG